MVVASGALFAVNGTVSKLVLRAGMDAPQLTTVRATGAFAGLLALCLAVRPRGLAISHRELPLLAAYGLAGFFVVPLLYFVAISKLPVGIALLFEYTAPLLVAIWARFGQRHPVRPRHSGGLPVWLLVGYVVVGGSIAPYLLVAGSLRHLPATSVGIVGMVEPVLAAAVAWLALGEALDPAQLAGGALVLAGVTLA